MTPEQQQKAAKFFAEMWDAFINDHSLDGSGLQEILEASGLCEVRPATAAEMEASGGDGDEGAPLMFLNTDGKAVRAAAEVQP